MTSPSHEHRIRLADMILTVMAIIVVVLPFIVMLTREYADHQSWCALPVHSIPNCGE
jgi:hypothetical protein